MSAIETGQKSELAALFVEASEQAVDGLLRSSLEPLLGLTRDGKVVTKPPFIKLSIPARILAILLARQALVRLKVTDAKASATPEELETECLAPLKTCREVLSKLKARRILIKTDEGYEVPVWSLPQAVAAVTGRS